MEMISINAFPSSLEWYCDDGTPMPKLWNINTCKDPSVTKLNVRTLVKVYSLTICAVFAWTSSKAREALFHRLVIQPTIHTVQSKEAEHGFNDRGAKVIGNESKGVAYLGQQFRS